jgi:hypothetical protein
MGSELHDELTEFKQDSGGLKSSATFLFVAGSRSYNVSDLITSSRRNNGASLQLTILPGGKKIAGKGIPIVAANDPPSTLRRALRFRTRTNGWGIERLVKRLE